ncbi:hypothetical protein [Haladaptatus sp. NG-SE-30]
MPESRIGFDRRAAISVTLLLLVVALIFQPGFLIAQSSDEQNPKDPDEVRMVSPKENSTAELWPFTSRQKSFDSLTLPINAIVQGHSARVKMQLRNQRDAQWNNDSNEWQGIRQEDSPEGSGDSADRWSKTTGAVRYTYIKAPGSRGGWVAETAQLHDGTYFGSRYHLRLYEGGQGNNTWTAIQAHHEHWDWFRLRHSVGSLSKAQYYLDSQYYGKWYVDDISRKRYANGGIIDTDGWVSVVDLRQETDLRPVPAALFGLLLLGSVGIQGSVKESIRELSSLLSNETTQRGGALAVSLFSLPLVVRATSIFVETTFPFVPVKAIAGVGYLTFVIGLPLAAIGLPNGRRSLDWFVVAVVGLGLGFLMDYQSIGVNVLPIAVVLHRIAVLTTVGVMAVGGARQSEDGRWNLLVKAGLVLWVCVLLWGLFLDF